MSISNILLPGVVKVMTQNIVYALPSRRCIFYTDATTPTILQSATQAFTASSAVTLTNGQFEACGAFIKCTSGDINGLVKEV